MAAAAWSWVEKMLQEAQHLNPELHQGLNQNRGLNGHVQGASNAGALKGFSRHASRVPLTRHLGLGDVELLATEIGLIDIGNDAINTESSAGRGRCHHGSSAP